MTSEQLKNLIVQYMGGERGATFYTLEAWRKEGERYCNENAAIVVRYNGADAGQYFSYDCYQYKRLEGLQEALRAAGYFHEDATGSYGGVYPIVRWSPSDA